MPINIQQRNGLLKPDEDMGFSLELRKINSKRHSSSKTAKECSALPQSNRSLKDADKLKSKSGVGPQHNDLKQKAKQNAEGSVQNVKRNATESDELVKHMSNLPGYLLRTDRVENSQEKAFNVGVLDWSRLEKWKHKHKHIPVLASNFTSFNSSKPPSRTATKSCTSLDDKKGLLSSDIRPSYRECLPESTKLPFQNVKQFESSKSGTKSIGDERRMTPREFESFGKTHSDISLEKKRRNDYSKRTSQVRHHGVSFVLDEHANGRDGGVKKNMEGLQEYNHKKKERNDESRSYMGQPSVKSNNKGVTFSSKKMSSSNSETRKKVDQLQESDFDIGGKHHHSKPSNIVLLYPQEVPKSSSSEDFRLSELRTSSDEKFSESSQSSLSYVSLPDEVYPEDGCSEIPLSCPLPRSMVELASSSETMRHSIDADLGIDRSSIVSETPASIKNKMSTLHSIDACFGKYVVDTKLKNQCVFSNLKESLDQETAELTAQKEMTPSHNRRFSFSLSRIGRSFSFKEGSTLPQVSSMYVSAKSGPVTPQSSGRWDNPIKEKANSHNRTKSSPLRRLLDPILKHKASDTNHSAESSHKRKGSMNSISFRTSSVNVNESLNTEKSMGSSIQGLLQLTIKNGVPLFKFVLNNERKIFVATRNSLASSQEKDDLGCCFTFYLVNEIKKKSGGWISHGSKEKSCGYAYNIVAQMKFSCSKITEPINQNSKRHLMVKEYVLLGVEIGQPDQGPPKFIQSKELGAVVIETPCESLSSEGLYSDTNFLKKGCLECLSDEGCLCISGENDISGSSTVILPGGVHGSPNKGEPSPLIYRWKTGGSCDCGGWDIGCKLLVLSNQKQGSNIPKSFKSYHDGFQLFVQEGGEQDTPHFTLLPLKDDEFYSVEFNSAISHLQAFFISVAILSCQKLPGSLEMGSMHEKNLKESSSKNSRLQGKAPVKYTPIPPLSPAGRV
ncbi:uncharacterized protein LOC133318372 [Gastrolobium bilobum]|uniref:uncharacterized protein LOC133318372 n=1 Tax=Gastrolobium bilobum TaxID=150636 RepID=UPI002AB2665B|nr:uncharacterized protein LOC133318372 [Gastrolobium bilobum]